MRALSYATGRSGEAVAESVEALDQRFAAEGYGIRALFTQIATMPEAYRVVAKPLESGSAHISMVAK